MRFYHLGDEYPMVPGKPAHGVGIGKKHAYYQ